MGKTIKTALISVFYKDGLNEIVSLLRKNGVKIISTGGTADFINKMGITVIPVEKITGFPSILGGRVKTLHPGIMGGILARRDNESDLKEQERYDIDDIDLVIVDLYPFQETVASGATNKEIIEKIDIGGISLIRAAAKNFNDVVIVPSKNEYAYITEILDRGSYTTEEERKYLAGKAFEVTSQYDSAIREYFQGNKLRYGENPHQSGTFIGEMDKLWKKLHGKEVSFNNMRDIEAAMNLVNEFPVDPAVAIIKHMNPCGFAVNSDLYTAFIKAHEGDPESAFGGILASNKPITLKIAEKIDRAKIFLEVIVAPGFDKGVVEVLSKRKFLIILEWNYPKLTQKQHFSCLNGILTQDIDTRIETKSDFNCVTIHKPTEPQERDMFIGCIVVKYLKSNAVLFMKDGQMISAGYGQTSRVRALKQAIIKAHDFGFSVKGAVLASDAFFPYDDCAKIAGEEQVGAIVQPGGSVKDQDSIVMCNYYDMPMVFTGVRHFKH